MSDSDEAGIPQRRSVAEHVDNCLDCLRRCLVQASAIHPRESALIEDQLASFSTWSSGAGVFSPGRASLDHRLRYTPDVHRVVVDLLHSLAYRIQSCLEVVTVIYQRPRRADVAAVDHGLRTALRDIAAEISRLHRMSSTISRAHMENHLCKASVEFSIRDDEGNDLEPSLLLRFKHCVRDCFPVINDVLQDRLARAMVVRRKRILFREFQQPMELRGLRHVPVERLTTSALTQRAASTSASAPAMEPGTAPSGTSITYSQQANSTLRGAATSTPERFQRASPSSLASSTNTTAIANHEHLTFPPYTGGRVRQEFEQDHPTNDLDPYVCLFEKCQEPDELYSDGDEWLKHMHRHASFWRCPTHRDAYLPSRDLYIRHMREMHSPTLTDMHLGVLADRSARRRGTLFTACPLCGIEGLKDRLNDHIVVHLQFLALKSLPALEEEGHEGAASDNGSPGPSRPQSRSSMGSSVWDGISVFDSNGPPSPTPSPEPPHAETLSWFLAAMEVSGTDLQRQTYDRITSSPRSSLWCELCVLGNCSSTFRFDQLREWVDHHCQHLNNKFPYRLVCWFCDCVPFVSSDAGQNARYSNFLHRMEHIREHIITDYVTPDDMRPDFFMINHLGKKGLIDDSTTRLALRFSELPDSLRFPGSSVGDSHPYQTPRQRDASQGLAYDLDRERRHRRPRGDQLHAGGADRQAAFTRSQNQTGVTHIGIPGSQAAWPASQVWAGTPATQRAGQQPGTQPGTQQWPGHLGMSYSGQAPR